MASIEALELVAFMDGGSRSARVDKQIVEAYDSYRQFVLKGMIKGTFKSKFVVKMLTSFAEALALQYLVENGIDEDDLENVFPVEIKKEVAELILDRIINDIGHFGGPHG